jgi:hypothetical protein
MIEGQTHIFGCCAESFPLANVRIASLDPLNFLPANEVILHSV